jgi:uncharacterized protein
MKFTVGEIKKKAHQEPFSFDGEADVSELESMNNDIRELKKVRVYGICTLQGDEIIFSMTISGKMILPCARTLVDVPYSFEFKADEIFSISPYYGEEEADNEIHPVEGEVIDLTPYIKENILLGVPFRVFSDDEEAQKNAPVKGEGWEFAPKKKQEKKIDPRLEKLQSFFKDDKDK